MEREMIVLVDDTKEKSSYGFMATPTPNQYAKKVAKMMDLKDSGFAIINRDMQLLEMIEYKEIEIVIISLCSRIVASAGLGGGLRTIVHIDMDIVMKNQHQYSFEVVRPDSFDRVFGKLNDFSIEIDDKIGVQKIYRDIDGAGTRSKYLSGNFGKMARKFKLDHPRRNK